MIRSDRLAIAALVVSLVLAGQASATLTRVRALGGGLSYLEDDANATLWYARLVDYPDRAVFDVGDIPIDAGGGGLANSGGGLHVGMSRTDPRTCLGVYVQDTLPADAPGGGITLLGAHRFGGLALGLKAGLTSYFNGENTTETYGAGQGLYYHDFGLGAAVDLSPRLQTDLAVDLVNVQGDAASQDLYALPYQQSWSTWGVRARAAMTVSDVVTLVPMISHRRDDRALFAPQLGSPADLHMFENIFGVGFRVRTDDANLIIVSGEYRRLHERQTRIVGAALAWDYDSADLSSNEVHARVGLESTVRPWLVVRAAMQYVRLQHDRLTTRGHTVPDEPDRWAESTSIQVLTPVTLGAGVALAPFTVDVTLNTRWREVYGVFPFGATPAPTGTYTVITVGYAF